MSRILPPCTECQERVLGCHSICEQYKKFKAELAELKAKKVAEYAERDFILATKIGVKKAADHKRSCERRRKR